MHWEIYYGHPQSGHTLDYARQQQVAQLPQPFAAAKTCGQMYIDREIGTDRITENNGCLAAPANYC